MADNRKLAAGLRNLPASAREDLAGREQDIQRGKTVELLRRAGKEMYENPIVNTAIGFTPVLGDIQAAGETMAALNRGAPWQETAGYAAGMLPFIPMLGGMTKVGKLANEAPQAQALREAEEYGQKMLGLPPGNTPMDRAIAGGYTPMYHGTADEIIELDPTKYGGSTRAQSAKEAFWGVNTVPTAEGYANYAAKDAPVKILIDAADKAGAKGDWDKADELINEYEALERDIYNQPLRGQNVMPMMVNTKNAKTFDLGGAEYTDVEGGINKYLNQGKREGKDVVVLENLSDDPGRSNMAATHYAVLNPSAVRSQFAAFDPRYFGKPGLMLGAGGLGVYGTLQGEDEYK
jgi:hypothetical protein